MKYEAYMSAQDNKSSPFERLLTNILEDGRSQRKVENFHPEDFRVIMDAIVTLFFNQSGKKGKKVGLEGLADYEGTKIEFSQTVQYPTTRKDRVDGYKVIVLPDANLSEEDKLLLAKEAIKEFDCLESVEIYELCLRIFHSFSEEELIVLASKFDPLKRDTADLIERLRVRAQNREGIK